MENAERAIFALADERAKQGFSHIKPIAEVVLAKVQEFAKRDSHALTGLSTGFRDLDTMTSGFQRSDLIIVAARPSMGKCLHEDSEIVLSDASIKTIREIFETKNGEFLTLQDNFKFKQTKAENFIDDGIKPVFAVITRLGRKIETTITHPFLTINGWQKLSELKIGDKIAVPRIIDVFGEKLWRDCEVKLLAYLLGNGWLTRTSPELSLVAKTIVQDDFVKAVSEFGGIEAVKVGRVSRFRVRKISGYSSKKANPLTAWLKQLGVFGCINSQKFIPNEVFTLKREQLSLFLHCLFLSDGWLSIKEEKHLQMGYYSPSEKLVRQVQHLLLRFGVIAKFRKETHRIYGSTCISFSLRITDPKSVERFAQEVGVLNKEKVFDKMLGIMKIKESYAKKDVIPSDIWAEIAAKKGDESWAYLAKRAGIKSHKHLHVGKVSPSRERLSKLADALQDEHLQHLASSEVYWDEIVSIEFSGNKQVYDLTIPETHNFVANDICVHNTALALNIAENAAILEGAVVAVFSLEMSKEQLVMRMLSSEARVDAQRFRNGFLTKDEWGRLAGAIGTLSEARLFIDDTPGISPLEMRAKARRLIAEQKQLDLIVVDYMQLMTGSGKRNENRQQEVSQISRELKGLAKELNVPVIALSQLSRAPEARNPPRPQMSDLRESGSIEQDADLVTFIYRDEYYKPDEENQGVAELLISKQRNGPTGTVKLAFLKEFTRFENYFGE